MPGSSLRATFRAALLIGVALATAASADAQAAFKIDVPAQPLADALRDLARQTSTNIIFEPALVKGIDAAALHSDTTIDAAIATVLKGTSLAAQRTSADTIVIKRVPSRSTSWNSLPAAPPDSAERSPLRLAQVPTATATAGTSMPATVGDSARLEEIVVTAQKKEERLQDVPVPVTAINAESLVDGNQLQLQDYYSKVPGLDLALGTRGEPLVAIRGVASVYANPTVGIVVDDLPQGSSIGNGGGFSAADIDPSELSRVEVLRGPQGTLYGATSMGGLIKYVTVDPSTAGVSGRLQVGTDGVRNAADPGYSVRGAINIPLTDTFAVRASGFSRQEPGYIDNVVSGQRDVNRSDAYGGRLAGLWKPTENLSLRLSALFQDSKRRGSDQADFGLADWQQNNLPGTGWLDRRNQAYSAILTLRIGAATLTSLTGYNICDFSTSFDLSVFFGAVAQDEFAVAAAAFPESLKNRRFSQELRLAVPITAKADWLLGAFVSDERTHWSQTVDAADPVTGATAGELDYTTYPSTYREYAAFTNLTFHVTNRFDVQAGVRESQDRQTFAQTDVGDLQLEGGSFSTVRATENAFTYLLTPQLRVSPDVMVYARFASGYRPGSPNPAVPGVDLPQKSDPDETRNYELGLKGEALSHVLTFDASLYYIDWQHIQLNVFEGSFSYNVNGGNARSQGVELAAELRPHPGLKIAAWVAWNDAVLTQALPANATVAGDAGDRLPLSSRWSGNLSVEEELRVAGEWTGFINGALSYVGNRAYNFVPLPPRQLYPAYAQMDLRLGARSDSWAITVYANNIADRRGVTGGGFGTIIPAAFTYIPPRTIGLTVARLFAALK